MQEEMKGQETMLLLMISSMSVVEFQCNDKAMYIDRANRLRMNNMSSFPVIVSEKFLKDNDIYTYNK